eukprot:CAMPEP_0168534012 /NCGR_PEP_ID=MMETSP0405-20121227/17548_1 /TAXON_ID=498012 /ORGANISM="Trichosphaerium sp, Strain Am-I-7 wt" /LENGTH=621 /DNA_ID=CAMNT_0008560441 /DNA_START=445 /DNA_END=2310 /DNA_ORIENTATION=+
MVSNLSTSTLHFFASFLPVDVQVPATENDDDTTIRRASDMSKKITLQALKSSENHSDSESDTELPPWVLASGPVSTDDISLDKRKLSKLFWLYYGDAVHSVSRVKSTPEINKKYEERLSIINNLEKAYVYRKKNGIRPTHKDYTCCGKERDSIKYYRHQLADIEAEIQAEHRKYDPKSAPYAGTAFVTFKTISDAMLASQSNINARWKISIAPDSKAIMWKNMYVTQTSFVLRRIITWAITLVLVLFLASPVSLIVASISSLEILDALPQKYGFVKFMVNLLRLISVFNGFTSRSEQTSSVMTKYVLFLMFNVWLFQIIAGSVLQVINAIASRPERIFVVLATAIPSQQSFFINYVMVSSFIGSAMHLWRAPGLFIRILVKYFWVKTRRQLEFFDRAKQYQYDYWASRHMLILLIVISYSTMAPLILPFGGMYFLFAYLESLYNTIYVRKAEYEGGGVHWFYFFRYLMVGLILYHLTIAGILFISFVEGGAIAVLSLIPITLAFWVITERKYWSVSKHGTVAHYPRTRPPSVDLDEFAKKYVQPDWCDFKEKVTKNPPTIKLFDAPVFDRRLAKQFSNVTRRLTGRNAEHRDVMDAGSEAFVDIVVTDSTENFSMHELEQV